MKKIKLITVLLIDFCFLILIPTIIYFSLFSANSGDSSAFSYSYPPSDNVNILKFYSAEINGFLTFYFGWASLVLPVLWAFLYILSFKGSITFYNRIFFINCLFFLLILFFSKNWIHPKYISGEFFYIFENVEVDYLTVLLPILLLSFLYSIKKIFLKGWELFQARET